ncbi:STYKc [Seminavis robusta]|uniref:STYKc n=1 Tax=Seminavis robusta TaxID=568900 RepID=A0A9N8EQF1_9STRA|nr:STYKc [Seminavis robusta]|eukprot:Sro1777_g296950.1 STYKc (361) ;mRNA; r:19576-20658
MYYALEGPWIPSIADLENPCNEWTFLNIRGGLPRVSCGGMTAAGMEQMQMIYSVVKCRTDYSLICDASGVVKYINISLHEIHGTIPPEISLLTGLSVLDLRGQFLSGKLPTEIGLMNDLTMMDASWNENLAGSVPSEIGNLSQLLNLRLDVTTLSGPIPREISRLSKLEVLSLQWTELSGQIPSGLFLLPNLRHLWHSSRDTADLTAFTVPNEIGLLTNLRSLQLNDVVGTIPTSLGLLTNLHDLHLQGILKKPGVSSTLPTEIGRLTSLHELKFGNQLNGNIPTEFALLSRLRRCDLAGNSLSATLPNSLGILTSFSPIEFDPVKLMEMANYSRILNMSVYNESGNVSSPLYTCFLYIH